MSAVASTFDSILLLRPSANIFMTTVLTTVLLNVSTFTDNSRVTFFDLSPTSVTRLRSRGASYSGGVRVLHRSSRHALTAVLVAGGFIGIAVVVLLGCIFTKVIRFNPGTC